MNDDSTSTVSRRRVLRTGGVVAAASVLGLSGTAAAKNLRSEGDKSFGAVYAGGELWRTNVIRVFDGRPDPEDRIYFLHDGTGPIVANPDANPDQRSPFVSESAPGDTDWNGGQWTHFSAEVTDIDGFNAAAPVDNAMTVLNADYIEVTLGRPGFGPPDYFLCPLNGRVR